MSDSDLNNLVSPAIRDANELDYKTPPLQNSAVFDFNSGTNSNNLKFKLNTSASDDLNRYDDVQNLPTPIVRPNIANKISLSPTDSNSSPKYRSFSTNLNPVYEHESRQININDSNSIKNKNSNNNKSVNNRNPMITLNVPKSREKKILQENNSIPDVRCISEYNDSDKKRDFSFNIKPVDRIASLSIQSPFLKDETSESINSLSQSLTTSSPSSTIQQFITYKPHSHVEQVWHCYKEIGSGSFSKVYLTLDNKVAVKVMDASNNKDQSEETALRIQSSLVRELELLQEIDHPNIVKLIGSNSSLTHDRVIMAMEYCKGGDLFSFVFENRSKISLSLIQAIFCNIVNAIYYLHNKNICHRDIKLENILLSFESITLLNDGVSISHDRHLPIAILSDFGLSKKIDPENPWLSTRCGSEDYVSPELLLGLKYDGKQNDCWSLGVLLYTILESRLPFDPLPNSNSRSKPSHRIAMISWNWYYLKDATPEYDEPKSIVNRLLIKRNKRATITDIWNDTWCIDYH